MRMDGWMDFITIIIVIINNINISKIREREVKQLLLL